METICIGSRLRSATREVSKAYDAALAPAGVTVAQFFLLGAIDRLGAPTINDLAAEARLDPSTLGRNIRVLEAGGLVEFGPGEDRRTRVARLSEKGRDALAVGGAGWRAAQADLERRLGPAGRDALFAMLDRLASSD